MMSLSKDILGRIKNELRSIYGSRLKNVILYGSEARGDAEEDSDIDLMILLDGDFDWWVESKKIIHALYPIQLEVIRPIHAKPVSSAEYAAGDFSLYRNVKAEGIMV